MDGSLLVEFLCQMLQSLQTSDLTEDPLFVALFCSFQSVPGSIDVLRPNISNYWYESFTTEYSTAPVSLPVPPSHHHQPLQIVQKSMKYSLVILERSELKADPGHFCSPHDSERQLSEFEDFNTNLILLKCIKHEAVYQRDWFRITFHLQDVPKRGKQEKFKRFTLLFSFISYWVQKSQTENYKLLTQRFDFT